MKSWRNSLKQSWDITGVFWSHCDLDLWLPKWSSIECLCQMWKGLFDGAPEIRQNKDGRKLCFVRSLTFDHQNLICWSMSPRNPLKTLIRYPARENWTNGLSTSPLSLCPSDLYTSSPDNDGHRHSGHHQVHEAEEDLQAARPPQPGGSLQVGWAADGGGAPPLPPPLRYR